MWTPLFPSIRNEITRTLWWKAWGPDENFHRRPVYLLGQVVIGDRHGIAPLVVVGALLGLLDRGIALILEIDVLYLGLLGFAEAAHELANLFFARKAAGRTSPRAHSNTPLLKPSIKWVNLGSCQRA
jgi:hypothetical protein